MRHIFCGYAFLRWYIRSQVGDPLTVVCDGCPDTCFRCSFGEKQKGPTCTSLPEAGIEHASSEGGFATIEDLYIYKGYWRATNSGPNIRKCFNTAACSGGMTGALDFCLSGYEGPCKPTRAGRYVRNFLSCFQLYRIEVRHMNRSSGPEV